MPVKNPNAGREYPNAGLDFIGDNAIRETYDHGAFSIAKAIMAAVGAGTSEAVRRVNAVAAGMDKLTVSSQNQLIQVHTALAEKMAAATVTAYENHPKRATPVYRVGQDRYSGGALLRALQNPSFYRGTPDGIGFVNVSLLGDEAKHWHRLNFGARGDNEGTIAGTRQATWDGVLLGEFGFPEESPSKGFSLPVGLWLNAAGDSREAAGASSTGQFYPQGGQGGQGQRHLLSGKGIMGRPDNKRLTKGINAWNFFDAGVKVLAEGIGPAYDDLYTGWFNSASRNAGPLKGQINLPAPKVTPYRSVI